MNTNLKGLFLLFIVLFQHMAVISSQSSENKEEFEFQAEIGRLMDIIINSLYTEKEIFLRELISNASDALDKIRFLSVSNPSLLGENKELEIRVDFDKESKQVIITDTGIGMTKNDLIQNLGTIAKSGTTNFIEAIKGGNVNIIGQFGVGFYASFLVGQKVTVISKHNDDDQYIWESQAANSFTIIKDPEGNTLGRGSKVIITLKQDAEEFANEQSLQNLIRKYSEFINFPIYLKTFKEVSREVEEEEEAAPEGSEEAEQTKEKPKKTKTIKEQVPEWKLINDNKAIWTRNKEDITDEEYKKFYNSLSKDYEEPLNWIHFKAEGELEFTSLLFIPKRAPHDLFENYHKASTALKLYVRRVLINEQFEELMPKYLNFIKGVVDSDDLPINVSRDSIQQVKMLKVMSRKLVRKALEMITKMSDAEDKDGDESEYETESKSEAEAKNDEDIKKEEDDKEDEESVQKKQEEKKKKYMDFWKEFGKNIKLGIIEDSSNRQKLAKLSRWYTSKNSTELVSLDTYIKRAKEGQDNIYYIAGENKETLIKHASMQKLLKKGYEVILLDDPIDEYTFSHLNEYEKKKLVNIAKGDIKLHDEDDNERLRFKKIKKMFKPLTDWWHKLLNADLDSVQISQRLVEDPCVVVSSESGQSANMERISSAQAYANKDRMGAIQQTKRILEINPSHPAIKELFERVKDDPDSDTEEMAQILYEGALVTSGYALKTPDLFAKRFYKLFNGALGIPKDAKIEDIDVDLEPSEEETPNQPESQPEGERIEVQDVKVEQHSDDL